MAELLACRRGTLVVLEGCDGIPGKLKLSNFSPVASIIVAPRVGQRVNVQFQTSLKESVYAYVFGDQMGNVSIQGIAFAGRCNGEDSGIQEVFDYYKDYRASSKPDLVTVTFGKEAMSGFLIEMRMTPRDSQFMTTDFSMTISTLPKKGSE